MEANPAVLKEKLGYQTDADTTSDDYIDFDIEFIISHGKLTNQEIFAEITDNVSEEPGGDRRCKRDFASSWRFSSFLKIFGTDVKVIKTIKS